MLRFLCAVAAIVLALPAFAARHVWTGAASGAMSDPANWIGGSPAGDPAAELSFPSGVERISLTNDIATLTVRAIAFSAAGYTITGNAITIAADATITDSTAGGSTIACNLILSGGVTFSTNGDSFHGEGLTIDGTIAGTGPVTKSAEGRLTFEGAAANTYSGATHVTGGQLRLAKPPFVTAVPGDLFLRRAWHDYPDVLVMRPEQIADAATVNVGAYTTVRLSALETLGPIVIETGGEISTSGSISGDIHYTGRLILGADVTVVHAGWDAEAQLSGNIILPATRTFTVRGDECCSRYLRIWSLYGSTPGAGVIFRGGDRTIVDVQGAYTGPTTVEGVVLKLRNPSTAVTVRGGGFTGIAASLNAHGGVIGDVDVTGDLRIGAGATLANDLYTNYYLPAVTAGGTVRLGGTFDPSMGLDYTLGTTYLLLENKGTQPIAGAFANAPEGGIVDGFRVSYRGGDGNDLTITDTRLRSSSTTAHVQGTVQLGGTVTLHAAVHTFYSPASGHVTFREGDTVLGTVALQAGAASIPFVLSRAGNYLFTASYSGNAATNPSTDTTSVQIALPPPAITSVEPPTVTAGETVPLVVRGTDFTQGSSIVVSATIQQTTFVSSTELRASWTAPKFESDGTIEVYILPSNYHASNRVRVSIIGVPRDASPLSWEPSAVSGPVTPGAQSVWLRGSLRPYSWSYILESQAGAVLDADSDGTVRWALSQIIPLSTKIIMADVQTGAISVGMPNDKVPDPIAFGASFMRDTNGHFSHVALDDGTHELMWVRPGAGAWWMSGTAGVINTSQAQPFYGTEPPPAGIEPGDVIAALHNRYENWYGGLADEHFLTGPGTLALAGAKNANESAGVVKATVVRTGGADGTVSVNYTTVDGSATAGVNFEARTGTLTFAPGEISKTVEIPILDDAVYGGSLTSFKFRLSDPVDATLGQLTEIPIQIYEDDPRPLLTLGPDVTMDEGDGDPWQTTFTVTLAGTTRLPVNLYWDSANGGHGTLAFAPGETQKSFTVTFKGNTTIEPDRNVGVSIYGWGDAAASSRNFANIHVLDDDGYVGITILDTTVDESAGRARVTIELTEYSERPVTVSYATESSTAFSGRDYTRVRGSVTLNLREVIEVPITHDTVAERDEAFLLVLSNPVSGRLLRSSAVIVITDDDHDVLPAISLESTSVQERRLEYVTARFVARLSQPSSEVVSFAVRTIDGTAIGGVDFQAGSGGRIDFYPGQTVAFVNIAIIDDQLVEPAEWFKVEAYEAARATIANAQATATIDDDDGVLPAVIIDRGEFFEGNQGLTAARFVLRLTQAASNPVTVNWATAPGTADSSDFQFASGQVIFEPGQTSRVVTVQLIGDTTTEDDETFTLTITSALNATVGRVSALGTIVNDDYGPKNGRR